MANNGTITGTVFLDANANNVQDSGDASLANLIVDLLDEQGKLLASIQADANGRYTFGGLAAGNYSVQYHSSGNARGNLGTKLSNGYTRVDKIAVADGATVNLNEGFYLFNNDIRGIIYNDKNNDGQAQANELTDGVTVQLIDAQGNVALTTQTSNKDQGLPGVSGVWSFYNLKPGTYTVHVVAADGTVVAGSSDKVFTIAANQDISSVLFALRDKSTVVSLSGTAFSDANGDGIQQSGEGGLARVNAVAVDANGYARQTTVTDADGHYSFDGLAAGSYKVVFGTPQGLKGTGSTTLAAGNLAAGQSKDHLDAGFKADTVIDKTGQIPNATTINVIIRGQSNTQYATDYGMNAVLKAQIEKLLGFDGVNQKVNIIASHSQADGAATQWPGTGMLADWLSPIRGDYRNGWTANAQELGLLSAIGKMSAADKANPTAIVWLHNESDSLNANLTKDMWQSAVRYEAGLVRAMLGQDASTTPYLFVNPIPFPDSGAPWEPVKNQTIRVGMQELMEDKGFNAAYASHQSTDITMNADSTSPQRYTPWAHMNKTDAQTIYARIALSLAEEFKNSARPGSAVAQANGNIDDDGPQVIRAETIPGQSRQLLVTVKHDQADHLLSPSYTASLGVGWVLRSSYDAATPLATGAKAEIVDGTHVRLTFDKDIPAGAQLFYAWGGAQLAINRYGYVDSSGNGNALYDDQGMPIWADPRGVSVTGDITPPDLTLTQTPGAQVEATSGSGASVIFAAAAKDAIDANPSVSFAEGSKTVSSGATFGLGKHTIDAFAVDAAGNRTKKEFTFTVVDTTAPTLTLTAPQAKIDAPGPEGAKVSFSGKAADTVDANPNVVFKEGDQVVTSGQSFGLGRHTISATATDASGNKTTQTFSFVVADPKAPTLTLGALPAAKTEATSARGAVVDFSATATDLVDTKPVVTFWEGDRKVASGDTFAIGTHTIKVTATDAAGNINIDSFSFTVTDSTAPTLSLDVVPDRKLAASSAAGASVVFAAHATDLVDTKPSVAFTENGKSVTSGQTFSVGDHTISATATDASGNKIVQSFSFSVAPYVTTPLEKTVKLDFALAKAKLDQSGGHLIVYGPDGVGHDLTYADTFVFTDGTVNERDGNPLVDDLYYYAHNLDVWNAHLDAHQHYAQFGWKEGRDPNADFSTNGYLAANPTVKAAGLNPLQHYDQFGWKEGRDPSAHFDNERYLAANPDVKAAGLDPLLHYLEFGRAEGRATYAAVGRPADLAKAHGFDAEFYLLSNPDVAKAALAVGGDSYTYALQHYQTYGWHEGRNPNAVFDTNFYLAANPSLKAGSVDPLTSYDTVGWKQGRDPSASFHTNAYLAANPDVKAAGIDPLLHYLEFGMLEGRHLA
ncbi:SdrD B-like domain-containing protein [Methylobacterium oxalidis]|uniref:SdrD B-like domain-containing protein n=1 Tax=Methylobacterium oxalidis TaxID=944322 RepID=UPI003314F460